MSQVAVTGYASLDHVIRLESVPRPNETAMASRPAGGWPRLGGSPSYVCVALARAGIRATPITWVAADEPGTRFVAELEAAGVPAEGVSRALQGPTPICILAYDPGG